MVKSATADTQGFPVGPLHLPSFHAPSTLLWVKEAVLQVRCGSSLRVFLWSVGNNYVVHVKLQLVGVCGILCLLSAPFCWYNVGH